MCVDSWVVGALGLMQTWSNSMSHLHEPGLPGPGAHIPPLPCGSEEVRDCGRKEVQGNLRNQFDVRVAEVSQG